MHVHPVPLEPYGQDSGTILPIRLPIFAVVMWLNDKIVNIFSIRPSRQANGRKYQSGLSKDFSDEVDSIEEGSRAPRVNYGAETSNGSANLHKQITGRVTIRRKLD